jgi:hypothetical protein
LFIGTKFKVNSASCWYLLYLKDEISYTGLVGRSHGKRPIGRHRHRWENSIKLYYKEVGWGGMDWITVVKDGAGG